MAIGTPSPGNRMLTPKQSNQAQKGFKNTPITGVSGATGAASGGMTRLSPGVYRNASGATVRQGAPTGAPVAKPPAATPTAKPPAPTTVTPSPFANKSYDEISALYKGSTDPRFRREAMRAMQSLGRPAPSVTGATGAPPPQPVPETTGLTGATGPTGPSQPYLPSSVQDYLSSLVPQEDGAEPGDMLPPEVLQQLLGILSGQQATAPTFNLPSQESLGQMFSQRYQQELADLTAGTEERQRKEQMRREQDLINRGISPDSEAYRAEQRALAESRALEAAQTRQQARGFAEQAVQSEYNRALAGAQEQRAAFEAQQAARYRPLETALPLISQQQAAKENRWATKYQADTQKTLTAMGLASDEKKFFANLGQQDRQFFETLLREDRKLAQDQAQWDKTFKESIRQFNENLKATNKKILADIQNDKNLTKIQRDQLSELVRSNRANEALTARKIAAANAGDNKGVDQIAAEQSAMIDGKIKGYYNSLVPLVGAERAKEMVEQTFGKGLGGYDVSR